MKAFVEDLTVELLTVHAKRRVKISVDRVRQLVKNCKCARLT